MYKDFERKSGFPVDGNDISKLAPGTASALAAVPFVEVILIHEAVGSRVALDAANSIGTSHGRIIGGQASEVNAASDCQDRAESEQTARVRVPNQNQSCFKKGF